MINKYIEEYKLPELQKILREQYRETFAEDTEDFISINSKETNIKNDTSSLNFSEAAKILNNNINLKMDKKLKSADIKEITDSILKLNLKVTVIINSKRLNMKVEPEFSYYVTNKEKATTEIIQKLNEIAKHEIENKISDYYQKFLNKKLSEGKIKKSDLLNLGQAKILREILQTYFSLNGSNTEELDLKLGTVLPKVIDINKKTTNLLDFLTYEASLYELLSNWHTRQKIKGQYFNQVILNKIRENFNKKISSTLEVDANENINLFKMNLKLSRFQILGFALGEMQINDVEIKWNIRNIAKDMSKIFEYVDIVLFGFISGEAHSNYIHATEPIWDPEKYKDIPKIPLKNPGDMKQEEYDIMMEKHMDGINQIISVDFVNWMKKRLNESLNSDDLDLDIANLEITTKYHRTYHPLNDFNNGLYLDSDITFKLREASFTLILRDILVWNTIQE